MNASQVAELIESIAPISSGMQGDELGFIFGAPDTDLRGVAVCWSPTLDVIQSAGQLGCNMIVSHEPLFFQKRWSTDAEAGNVWFEEAEDEEKAVNRGRAAALEGMGACVYRAHSNWDLTPEIGIRDALAAALDLGPAIRLGQYTSLHEVEPVTIRGLVHRVQTKLDTGPIRVVGNPAREATRIGTLYGGLGQMLNSPEEMASLGAEAVIAGECLAYTLWCAKELGLALIEAGHCATENPGMRAMANWLDGQLGDLPVQFIDTGRPWQCL